MLAELGEEAVEVDVEGRRGWALTAGLPELGAAGLGNVARLLPAFDPWVIGMARRKPTLDARHVAGCSAGRAGSHR